MEQLGEDGPGGGWETIPITQEGVMVAWARCLAPEPSVASQIGNEVPCSGCYGLTRCLLPWQRWRATC